MKQGSDGCETVLGFAVYGQGILERIECFKRGALQAILRNSLGNSLLAFRKLTLVLWSRLGSGVMCKPTNFLICRLRKDANVLELGVFITRHVSDDLLLL